MPDTLDGGKYSDDVPLPDNKKSSRSEENEGGVESKSPNDAVFTKVVQLKLKQSIIKSNQYQILPCFMIHVTATENEVQMIHTKFPQITSPRMQTNSTTKQAFEMDIQAMKIYINTMVSPNNMKHEFAPENEYEEESSAILKTVLFLFVEKSKTFKQLISLINPVEETNECNFAHNLNVPEDGVTMEESMVMDKEISKVEAREEAVSPSILLFLYNTKYYKIENDRYTKK